MKKKLQAVRAGIVGLEVLSMLKDKTGKNEYVEMLGVNVKITSQRYALFQKSVVCVKCGIEGQYFAVENSNLRDTNNYHLNLYALDADGKEVLMTKDHILPSFRGGKNHSSNYQTMCTVCNHDKGAQ